MSLIFEAALGQKLADRLHKFIKQVQRDNARGARRDVAVHSRINDLEADLGFLAMLVVAALKALNDKKVITDAEFTDRLAVVDRLDGVEDGALAISAIRDAIGLPRRNRGLKPKPAPARDRVNDTNGTKGAHSGHTRRIVRPKAASDAAPGPAAALSRKTPPLAAKAPRKTAAKKKKPARKRA